MSYDGSSIQVLEGLNAVRINPGMYIDSVGKHGLHHMLWEVLDNSIDESMVPKSAGGTCDKIDITINKDNSITVKDNGRGIPVDMHETGKPTIEVALSTLHAGGKFKTGNSYDKSGGLHGVGISVVNALSSKLEAVVERDGTKWGIGFAYTQKKKENGKKVETVSIPGDIVSPLAKIGKAASKKSSGTSITFLPDENVFTTTTWDYEIIKSRVKEAAYLNSGVTLTLLDNRVDGNFRESFIFYNGIIDLTSELVNNYVHEYNVGKADNEKVEPVLPNIPIVKGDMANKGSFSTSFQWVNNRHSELVSFSNSIKTTSGGVHLDGLLSGLRRALNKFAVTSGKIDEGKSLDLVDIKSGLILVLSAQVSNPQYEGQTKGTLTTSGYKTAIASEAFHVMWDWVQEFPAEASLIVDKALKEMTLRKKLDLAEIEARKTDKVGTPSVNLPPSKLVSCLSKDNRLTELYIVEGDSAQGPAEGGRNAKYQAILPIKGKILNAVENRNSYVKINNQDVSKVDANAEVQSIFNAIGSGTKDFCDPSKSKFSKIIILTDADEDGKHISLLLMTLFAEHMYPLIEAGMIYVARTPVRATTHKGEKIFVDTEEEFLKLSAKYPNDEWTKFKGLGEMNVDQLAETALDPVTRTIVNVVADDYEELMEVIEILMTKNDRKRAMIMNETLDIREIV